MCGIGALLDPGGTWPLGAAERMVEALRHRGPDGDALRRIGPLALAHTRLAIIDVAGGDQPLDSELVDPASVSRLVAEHRRGRADHKAILFCLLELSEWHGAFVEAREPVAA